MLILLQLAELYRVSAGFYRAEGYVKNVNTIEDYRVLDKSAVLERAGRTVSVVLSGTLGSG